MAQRRERPPVQAGDTSVGIRLPGGRTFSVPTRPAAERCCFCGEPVGDDRVTVSASWRDGDEEQWRTWQAHAPCLAERLHESARF